VKILAWLLIAFGQFVYLIAIWPVIMEVGLMAEFVLWGFIFIPTIAGNMILSNADSGYVP
jgi:hypothetical protein